ncbi:protein-tyrosine kinase 6b [Aulostomus maculatus]
MGECLRNACPCLEVLWQRIYSDKKAPSEEVGGGGGEERPPGAQPPPPVPLHGRRTEKGAIYRAMWPFEGRLPEEISFQEGDLFSLINREGDWWTVQMVDKNGRILGTGVVPANYLMRAENLEKEEWYFGTMSRYEAQSHLLAPGNDQGAFLIRLSEKDNVGYVLSVRSNGQVKHFKILQERGSFYVEPNRQFSSLTDLVEHFCSHRLTVTSSLGQPCRRKEPKTDVVFPDDEWECPKEEFTLEEKLGGGYFADVYRGCWKKHINVAIKIIKSDSEMNHCEFQREVQILKSLRHRHLIALFAVCTKSTPYYIITELMEKGSLLSLLRSPEGQQQDLAALVDMGAQVADGMLYLEEQHSIHRDLAARNVLVGEDYICKVADFGLARIIKEPFYVTEEKKIPFKWSAPEAISHGKFSIKSDVWSFGILLYEIITYGGIPYPAWSNQETYQQVTHGYRMPAPPKCPDFLYQIMLKCWSSEPADRPHFKFLKVNLETNSYDME